jgi:trimeric autotransporter adhesin
VKTRYLLAGISAMALAATAATAQNLTADYGENNTVDCDNVPGNNNDCDIRVGTPETNDTTASSDNNTAIITQPGMNNDGEIDIDGDGNTALITQPGNRNDAEITQTGDDNSASIVQRGRWNTASITQSGDDQGADVRQSSFGGGAGGTFDGEGNEATVNQTEEDGGTDDDSNRMTSSQRGEDNILRVTQSGERNSSDNIQGQALNADGTVTNSPGRLGFNNSITVTQSGEGNYSDIKQASEDSEGTVSDNIAIVSMGQGNDDSELNGNVSTIRQRTSDNWARSVVFGGEREGNTSSITQRGGDGNEADVSLARGGSEVAARGNQQEGYVTQNGDNNYAEVTITGGLAGNNVTNDVEPGQGAEGGRSGGNYASVTQNGDGNGASVSIQTPRTGGFRGFGNSATIVQNASENYQDQTRAEGVREEGTGSENLTTAATTDRRSYREFNTGADSRNYTGARGNYVETWQQGRFDTLSVTQSDNENGSGVIYGGGGADPNQIGRSRAAVYQNSSVGNVTITQTGDNYGEVTQGVGTEQFFAVGNVANLTQIDSGDDSTPGAPGGTTTVVDEFGNTAEVPNPDGADTPVRTYNQALLGQFGEANTMAVTQNAENAYASTRQRVGSSNLLMQVEQGTGTTADYTGATLNTTGAIGAATAGASHTATANVDQGGTNNGVRVRQDSSDSVVNVLQLGQGDSAVTDATCGTGVFGGQEGGNVIQVIQQGSDNRATAVQGTGVARSDCVNSPGGCPQSGNSAAQNEALVVGTQNPPADEFFFAGGERSAEIDILQGGTNNTARAEQKGAGQYARIEQAGDSNEASILQDVGATNATAIIRQVGDNNSYNIYQNQPGQYVLVDQTGDNNGTRVGRGANTGSGFDGTGSSTLVPPAGAPATVTP